MLNEEALKMVGPSYEETGLSIQDRGVTPQSAVTLSIAYTAVPVLSVISYFTGKNKKKN